jgi:DNA-binding IclR family transcriptional regulator
MASGMARQDEASGRYNLGPAALRIYNGRPALLASLQVGSVLPLAASATGRVFLAYMPNSETKVLMEREGAAEMASALMQIRRAGCASESSSVVPGLRATAFPVLDLQGRAILVATAIMSQSAVGREDGVAELGILCCRISAELGWQVG